MATTINYALRTGHPDLIAFCEHCTEPDCEGICQAYKDEYRRVYSMPKKRKVDKHKSERPKRLTLNGETHTIREWSEISGIRYSTLVSRLYRYGYTLEKAISRGVTRNPRTLTYRGKTQTIAEWTRELCLSSQTIYNRLHAGQPIEEVLREYDGG